MQIDYQAFISTVFTGIIALFPVVNPVGSAFILTPYFENLSRPQRHKAVTKIVLYAFFICIVALFLGHWILLLFGITIPVVQLGGGIMICKMGWEFLSGKSSSAGHSALDKEANISGYDNIADKLFYPITFPATTGAGTISVLFTLSADDDAYGTTNYYVDMVGIIVAIVVMCILVYIFYLNTKNVIHMLGRNGEQIVNRISAFLIFCVGLQIAFSGIKALFHIS